MTGLIETVSGEKSNVKSVAGVQNTTIILEWQIENKPEHQNYYNVVMCMLAMITASKIHLRLIISREDIRFSFISSKDDCGRRKHRKSILGGWVF